MKIIHDEINAVFHFYGNITITEEFLGKLATRRFHAVANKNIKIKKLGK